MSSTRKRHRSTAGRPVRRWEKAEALDFDCSDQDDGSGADQECRQCVSEEGELGAILSVYQQFRRISEVTSTRLTRQSRRGRGSTYRQAREWLLQDEVDDNVKINVKA